MAPGITKVEDDFTSAAKPRSVLMVIVLLLVIVRIKKKRGPGNEAGLKSGGPLDLQENREREFELSLWLVFFFDLTD